MTKIFKCLLSALLLLSVIIFSASGASAATTKDSSHELSIDLPDDYTVLKSDTAKENADLIESLGYTVDSFKNYLKPTKGNPTETLFLAVNSDKKSQISLKTWSTEFSKKIGDFSRLDDSSLLKTAKELVLTENAAYKIVKANGMKLVEVRNNNKDSGGDFCSVQYLTVRSDNFYSLNFTFSGKLNDQKVQSAWDSLTTLHIGTVKEKAVWDVNTILIIILLSTVIIVAVVVGVIIIISIIKDIKKHRLDTYESTDYILRRK